MFLNSLQSNIVCGFDLVKGDVNFAIDEFRISGLPPRQLQIRMQCFWIHWKIQRVSFAASSAESDGNVVVDKLLQFVNFSEIMAKNLANERKEAAFALAALMEIPQQYKATMELELLG